MHCFTTFLKHMEEIKFHIEARGECTTVLQIEVIARRPSPHGKASVQLLKPLLPIQVSVHESWGEAAHVSMGFACVTL